MTRTPLARALLTSLCLAVAALPAGCGNDDAQTSTSAAANAELSAVKDFLTEHTARLVRDTAAIRENAEAYHRLAQQAQFDYARLLRESGSEVRQLVRRAQAGFRAANPSYEEMEGVVAGVPELADYDVIIDAGGDASDPENAVPFDIETPDGRTFEQPGNFNYRRRSPSVMVRRPPSATSSRSSSAATPTRQLRPSEPSRASRRTSRTPAQGVRS
jgi:hypothetical protein